MFKIKVDGYETEVLHVDIIDMKAKFLIWDARIGEFRVISSDDCEFVKDIVIH